MDDEDSNPENELVSEVDEGHQHEIAPNEQENEVEEETKEAEEEETNPNEANE